MNEAEWLACTEPGVLLRFLQNRTSERKLRRFAIACCRRIWDYINDPRSRAAVEFAEQYADVGTARRRGRPAVANAARRACNELDTTPRPSDGIAYARLLSRSNARHSANATIESSPQLAADWAAGFAANAVAWAVTAKTHPETLPDWDPAAREVEWKCQMPLARCIFGNPFQRCDFDPAWRSRDVLDLARSIDEHAAFDGLPLLHDALIDAGCTDDNLLAHCRDSNAHARGCWVVDLVLEKK